jgi:hypothetical protein
MDASEDLASRLDFPKSEDIEAVEEIGLNATTDPADNDGLATTLGTVEDIEVLLEMG